VAKDKELKILSLDEVANMTEEEKEARKREIFQHSNMFAFGDDISLREEIEDAVFGAYGQSGSSETLVGHIEQIIKNRYEVESTE